MPPVIRFENVSKQYRTGAGRGSIREAIGSLPRRALRSGALEKDRSEHVWALRNLSFELEPGQILGLIGRNGAGKTTALKLLSRVVRPTHGRIDVSGRISALIELGAGFHPDLTGRENVYLNGVILGMSRKEIDAKFDQIVAFAEIDRFIDTPVKRYSSGMYARLGFAVAAFSDPDVLLIDEVLAVGDVGFQRKCYDFLHAFVSRGRTAVFVSHSMYVLEQLCNRLIWLDHGDVIQDGAPGAVLPAYLDRVDEQVAGATPGQSWGNQISIGPATFSDAEGQPRSTFTTGEDVVAKVPYNVGREVERPHFNLGILGPDGTGLLFTANMLVDGAAPEAIDGSGLVRCRFKSVPLMPRAYSLWGEVWAGDRSRLLADWQRLGGFRVLGETDAVSPVNERGSVWHSRADAPIHVAYEWQL